GPRRRPRPVRGGAPVAQSCALLRVPSGESASTGRVTSQASPGSPARAASLSAGKIFAPGELAPKIRARGRNGRQAGRRRRGRGGSPYPPAWRQVSRAEGPRPRRDLLTHTRKGWGSRTERAGCREGSHPREAVAPRGSAALWTRRKLAKKKARGSFRSRPGCYDLVGPPWP